MTVVRVEPVSWALFLCVHKSSDDNKMAVFLQKTQTFSGLLNVKTHQAAFVSRVLLLPLAEQSPSAQGRFPGRIQAFGTLQLNSISLGEFL